MVIYANDGQKIKVVIGTRGCGERLFNVPLQATVGPDGTLYAMDSDNFQVQAFDREGSVAAGASLQRIGDSIP